MIYLTYAMAYAFPVLAIGSGIATIFVLIPFVRDVYADIRKRT